jgi:hypothetical protein
LEAGPLRGSRRSDLLPTAVRVAIRATLTLDVTVRPPPSVERRGCASIEGGTQMKPRGMAVLVLVLAGTAAVPASE